MLLIILGGVVGGSRAMSQRSIENAVLVEWEKAALDHIK